MLMKRNFHEETLVTNQVESSLYTDCKFTVQQDLVLQKA